jgi:hypothetical protein
MSDWASGSRLRLGYVCSGIIERMAGGGVADSRRFGKFLDGPMDHSARFETRLHRLLLSAVNQTQNLKARVLL